MYFENEISDSELLRGSKTYTKIKLRPSEEAKHESGEILSKKKKQIIQKFLNDVHE